MSLSQNTSGKKVTPRALVRKQIENESFHVSEEDIKNLDTSIETMDSKISELAKHVDENDTDKTLTSY